MKTLISEYAKHQDSVSFDVAYDAVLKQLPNEELIPLGTVYRGGDNPHRMSWTTNPLVAIRFAQADGVIYKIDNAMGYVINYDDVEEEYRLCCEEEVLVLDTSSAEVIVENKDTWFLTAFKLIIEECGKHGDATALLEAFHNRDYIQVVSEAIEWVVWDEGCGEYMPSLASVLGDDVYGMQLFDYEVSEEDLLDNLYGCMNNILEYIEEYS